MVTRSLIAAMLFLGACQSPPDLAQLKERPEDFTIAATVYAPPSPRPPQRHLRPARFILEADSALRWSPGSAQRSIPPPVRHLTPSESTEIWNLARDSGLLEPDSEYRTYGPVAIDTDTLESPVAVFEIAFAGAQVASRIPLDRSTDEAVLAERILSRLAEMAFVRE